MDKKTIKYISFTIILITFGSLLTSCSNGDGQFPQIASPPPFDYQNGEELRSGMHQLAFALLRLDTALTKEDDYDEDPNFQRNITSTLNDIERISEDLQTRELNANHPFLTEGMKNFLADVKRAQFSAERNQYYMAGRISGACMSCHQASY